MKGSDLFHQRACREPFIGLHPSVANFFRDYLSREKAVKCGDHFVINIHFPPFPGKSFNNLAERFGALGEPGDRRLYFSHARRYQPVRLPLLASLLQCSAHHLSTGFAAAYGGTLQRWTGKTGPEGRV